MALSGSTVLSQTPRRLGLTLPELQLAGRVAHDAPLPFDLTAPTAGSSIASRLGASRVAARDSSYRRALAGLPDHLRERTEPRRLVWGRDSGWRARPS
jgi:hypothetical protein